MFLSGRDIILILFTNNSYKYKNKYARHQNKTEKIIFIYFSKSINFYIGKVNNILYFATVYRKNNNYSTLYWNKHKNITCLQNLL